MNKYIISRVKEEACHMIETNLTIREIARVFKVSKSTVHKDLHERLIEIDTELYNSVQNIIQDHINIRHINGGLSTKKKYLKMNEK